MSEFNEPLYQKIYNSILEDMKKGTYLSGDRLPSEKELAVEFKVSRITSKKALEMLAKNGLIKRMPGKGSFVLEDMEKEIQRTGVTIDMKNSTYLIGVVIPDFSESYGMVLISGIEEEAAKNGYSIVPRRSHGHQDIEEEAIEALIDLGVDGIIIMPVHGEYYSPKILRLVLDGYPVTIIDRQLKGIPAPFVGTDNVEAAKKAVSYLLELGHRNISILSPPPNNTTTIENRIEGFVKSYVEHGLALDESLWNTNLTCTIPGHNDREHILQDIDSIKKLLEENSQITCLFAVEYNIALLAKEAVKALGKKIPEDISMLCFDGPYNFIGEYALTHIRQEEYEMGHMAFKLLQKQIEDGEKITNEFFIESELVIGKSTAKLI